MVLLYGFSLDNGAVAQLGERLLCKQEVVGSIPSGSTINRHRALMVLFRKVFFEKLFCWLSSCGNLIISRALAVLVTF